MCLAHCVRHEEALEGDMVIFSTLFFSAALVLSYPQHHRRRVDQLLVCDDQASFRPQHGPGVLRAPVAKIKRGSSDKQEYLHFVNKRRARLSSEWYRRQLTQPHEQNNVRADASPLNSCYDFRESSSLASGTPKINN